MVDAQLPSTEARVIVEQVAAQARTDWNARWPESLFAIAVASFYYWQTGANTVFVWLGVRAAVHVAGWLIARGYVADPEREANSARWGRTFAATTALDSAVWGLAVWFLPPAGDPLLHGLLLLIIGLASSGAIYATQVWPVVLTWVFPMNLGLITALLWQGGPVFIAMVVCALMSLGIVLLLGRDQQRLVASALRARFENEALAERLEQQVDIAERANREKTRFLAAASHDLRQPMHAITLFGTVLEEELTDHPQHDNAERLMRAADALATSLDAMLDVSRLDAGAIVPTVRPVPLNPLFRRLGQSFIAHADANGLQLRLRATPLWVRTDPVLLYRILSNLLDNALKYTKKGGVLVAARRRGDSVWVEVRDTGPGIPEEHQEAVFQEFYQVDNPGRDRALGLGMGLSIVQRMTKLLSHPLELESRAGRGTCVRLTLPLSPPTVSTEPSTSLTEDARSLGELPDLVLVVDDEREIADAMSALLGLHGASTLWATNSATAHRACAEALETGYPVKALVCDLRLANGEDGLALALDMRWRYATGGTPLPTLIITGETAPEPLRRVRESGLPVLFKPVSAAALIEALATTPVACGTG